MLSNPLRGVFQIAWIGVLAVLAFDMAPSPTMAGAQEVTAAPFDSVCGCSAATYTFVLDFSLTCPPTNITTGFGVASISCLISPFGAPTNNLYPAIIDSVSILELDQSNNVLVEERIDGEFVDGDSFSYSSIINNPEDVTSSQNIPRALQLNLNGRNSEGVILLNVFVITFTNECGVTPVIQKGESAGWTIFSQMSGPIPKFCPTLAPSSTPSDVPTTNPTQQPTQKPSRHPTQFPSPEPTRLPTGEPSQSSIEPTENATRLPTEPLKPSEDPTSQPIRLPTDVPTRFSIEPLTQEPTVQSTRLPTENPTRFSEESVQPTPSPTSQAVINLTNEPTRCPTNPPTRNATSDSIPQATTRPTSNPTEPPTLPPTKADTTILLPSARLPTLSPSESPPPTLFDNMMSMSMSLTESKDSEFQRLLEANFGLDLIEELKAAKDKENL